MSKVLTVSERDSDFGVLIRQATEQKNPGENPFTGISLNFLFPFQSWQYSSLESPPTERYLQHYNPASAMKLNGEARQQPLRGDEGEAAQEDADWPRTPRARWRGPPSRHRWHLHTFTPPTTSQAHSRASRSPSKVALQSHLGDTGISLKTT